MDDSDAKEEVDDVTEAPEDVDDVLNSPGDDPGDEDADLEEMWQQSVSGAEVAEVKVKERDVILNGEAENVSLFFVFFNII